MNVTADISDAVSMNHIAEIYAETLESHLAGIDDRLGCVRVALKGRTPIHGRLLLQSDEVVANIRAVSAEVSRQRVLIEEVRIETQSKMDLETLIQSDSPQGELLRYLQELTSPADLDLDYTPLKSRLAGSGIDFPVGNETELLLGAKDILISMLTDATDTEAPS